MIETIASLAENLTPVALIGAGGIGKTSIALAILHHRRVKERFGDDCRFIRCDQFPASLPHFLRRLSDVIGAGVEKLEDLTPIRPFLSSREMFIVLDNAESILDPQGMDAQEIYAVVEELSRFSNICICITSRISTVPPDCETFDIPTLSIEAARDAFYRIYKNSERSNMVDNILEQLDFHPLSITLLATVARHNKWGTDRLTREWERQRIGVLQTEHNKSIAATIELSLTSPMFQELGSQARALLGVVAFFPQGVDENNLDWLFPTIPNGTNLFDKFCILSLTHRTKGFITMLAPLRDYLRPKDPKSSPLLCTTKESYFTRMSVVLDPNKPDFGEARWITSEDVNVEHLLDIFTSIDANSDDVWEACDNFMNHLTWHKQRLIILGPKIEGLPDNHPSKPRCVFLLSLLSHSVGNRAERKRLLTHTLKLGREREDDYWVARALGHLASVNREMGLHEEGIRLAREASGIHERLGDTVEQAWCLNDLAWSLYQTGQLDAAEEAASRAINLLSEKDQQYRACASHRVLGDIYISKGEREKAINRFETVLEIASSSNWQDELYWAHCSLAQLFLDEGRFNDTHDHVERAKAQVVNDAYKLGHAMELQAELYRKHHRLEEARSEALRAAGVYEKLGAAQDLERCREHLRQIEEEMNKPVASGQLDFNCEFVCVSTLRSKLRKPNDRIDGCIEFFKPILPQVTEALSPHPVFSSLQECSLYYLPPPLTQVVRSVAVVPPLVVDPPPSLNVSPSPLLCMFYLHMCLAFCLGQSHGLVWRRHNCHEVVYLEVEKSATLPSSTSDGHSAGTASQNNLGFCGDTERSGLSVLVGSWSTIFNDLTRLQVLEPARICIVRFPTCSSSWTQ